jgi:hypothetical protein
VIGVCMSRENRYVSEEAGELSTPQHDVDTRGHDRAEVTCTTVCCIDREGSQGGSYRQDRHARRGRRDRHAHQTARQEPWEPSWREEAWA